MEKLQKDSPREHTECWNETLRNTCKKLFASSFIRSNFFLSGGAALSVFYFGHRKTNNIDLFTVRDVDFSQLKMHLQKLFPDGITVSNEQYICLRIPEKVSFAKDHLSKKTPRPIAKLDRVPFMVDTIENLLGNKMSAFVSRFERNDVIDILHAVHMARNKEVFAQKLLLRAQEIEMLAEDVSYVSHLFSSVEEIYPDIAKRFSREINIFKGVLLEFDEQIGSLYR